MKKFKWRLQRILEVKRKEEELKKNELLKVTEKIVSKRSRLLVEKNKLKEMADEVGQQPANTRIRQQQLFIKYARCSNEFIEKIKQEIEKLEQLKRRKIKEYREIQKSKESMEKLRQKAKEKYLQDQTKREQKEIDENFAAINLRNRGN
jgi:flagellar FliJ protein